jgi:putative ABC transport system permease protein
MSGPVILIDQVSKSCDEGPPAIGPLSLTVAQGECLAVLGPSGSGKSTLLNLIAGLDRPSSGQVIVDGVRVDGLGEAAAARYRRARIGMVFQFFNLIDDLTVLDNVLLAGRAGRMRVIEAPGAGHTPGARRGRRAHLLLSRGPLPRALSLGLATPFTRPARALALISAVAMGVLAATLAVGVASSLGQATADVAMGGSQGKGIMVEVGAQNAAAPPTAAQDAAAVAAVTRQPGTAAYFANTFIQMPVEGFSQDGTVLEYQGDASWGHYPIVSGRWLTGPGQAVLPTQLLRTMNLHLGDTVTVVNHGEPFPLTVVGEVFDVDQSGMVVMTDAQTFASAQPQMPIGTLSVELEPGVDQSAYIAALDKVLGDNGQAVGPQASKGGLMLIISALSVMLTLMPVAVAALGVVGSVVLDTRERVHDIGVYKALGMTPRQTTAMVLTSVLSLGLMAGAVGVPLGVLAHGLVLPLMGDAVQAALPADVLNVYHPAELGLLALGGVAIALLAALGPAGWAGRIRTASALRTE